jgi:hypothetical protein
MSAMSIRKRLLGVVVLALAIAGLALSYVLWLTSSPSPVRAGAEVGGSARLTLQTVAALGPRYGHPDWVSYLAQKSGGEWVHSTSLQVPAHSVVHVTIDQYDTATGLRNPYFARVQGTIGGTMRVDGSSADVISPDDAAHSFAIPELGVYVPLPGVADDARNQCSAAPCTAAQAHRTITFTFRTRGKGRYRWQCFVPCGAGFVSGNGGPMQTFNYMAGFLTVV